MTITRFAQIGLLAVGILATASASADLTGLPFPTVKTASSGNQGRIVAQEVQGSYQDWTSYGVSSYDYVMLASQCSDSDDDHGGAQAYLRLDTAKILLCHAEGTGHDDAHDASVITLNVKAYATIDLQTDQHSQVTIYYLK